MTIVVNEPDAWPFLDSDIVISYWIVAAGVMVVYDWVLAVGQEIELIWRQRWSLMTVLYLVIRYIGILYTVDNVLANMPFVSQTDAGCNILYDVRSGTNVVVAAMLCVIIIAQLHAMYQRSRTMLFFLVIIFLAVNIACGGITATILKNTIAVEFIISGTFMCVYETREGVPLLATMIWAPNTVWEVLTLCLLVWIAIKHFRDLQLLSPSTGSTIGGCFRVLIKSQVLYFASSLCTFGLQLGSLSMSSDYTIVYGAFQVFLSMQMFVLGPRLILSVREYHARLVAGSDAETSMKSIVFQERLHIQTSSIV